MKYNVLSGALLATSVAAFPSMGIPSDTLRERAINAAAPQGVGALPLTPPAFDAAAQHVSVSGEYAFVAPGPGDERGPCPGLNAMANHGYIPHNGFATIQQFIDGTQKAFGMAYDLGAFLAYYGAWVDGNGAGWSIRGVPHTGIGGSHNNYEADSSPVRGDLHQYGSNSAVQISQFKALYDLQPDAATANYNLEVLREFRGTRYQQSISENPVFVYNPFGGILVSQAAFTFIYRFMSNKSAEYPEGVLNKEVLKSFYSIHGPEDNLYWIPGHERFPENFYKRNQLDDYSIPYFLTDVLYFAETQPEILVIGCNEGKLNSYDAIDPAVLSGGSYTKESVAANPGCFASSYLAASMAQSSDATIQGLASKVTGLLGTASCAAFSAYNASAFNVCPGNSLYGGPLGYIAPGAIQN